jgi:hypothetical protein
VRFERVPVVNGKARTTGEDGVEGPGVETGPLRAAMPSMEAVTKLVRVGRRLAVYGYREAPTKGASKAQASQQLATAHIVNPGSYTVPQVANHPMAGGSGLAHGRSLCGIRVVTNGFASDFTPPEWELCPACKERI